MENYIVNGSTMALIYEEGHTVVYEIETSFIVNKTPLDIIRESCLYYGSSLDGRVSASRNMLNCNYKLPIIVEEVGNLVFFPISSIKNKENSWFALSYVNNILKFDNKSIIKLDCGVSLNVNSSKFSLETQMLKASRLLLILNQRKQ